MAHSKRASDFTSGPIFFKIIQFTLPLMGVGLLQVLYNIADKAVVGRFSSDPTALAAIGSTSTFNALLVNLLIGLAGGSGVVVAHLAGASRESEMKRTVSTALIISAIGGIVIGTVGFAISEPVMRLMTKAELVRSAALYMRIICVGIPALSVYNFTSAILRSVGDSKTPLAVGAGSGLINVAFNLIFVLAFGMSVDGVAWATVISQYVSAAATVAHLIRHKSEAFGLNPREICFDLDIMRRVLRLGIPQGLQTSVICFANMICTATFNSSFAVEFISASAIAGTIDVVIYTCMNCFGVAVTTFTGQNMGANRPDRAKRALLYSLTWVLIVAATISLMIGLFGPSLATMFVDASDPASDEILRIVRDDWFRFICWFYFIHGLVSVLAGFVRGVGYSVIPAIFSFIGDTATKVIWMTFIFPIFKTSAKWYNLGHIAGWSVNLILFTALTLYVLSVIKHGGIKRISCAGSEDETEKGADETAQMR